MAAQVLLLVSTGALVDTDHPATRLMARSVTVASFGAFRFHP